MPTVRAKACSITKGKINRFKSALENIAALSSLFLSYDLLLFPAAAIKIPPYFPRKAGTPFQSWLCPGSVRNTSDFIKASHMPQPKAQGPPGSNAPRSRSPSRRRTAPSPAALIIGPQIKPPCYLLCLYHIDKRLRINLPYFRDNSPLFLPGNHAVQQLPLLALIAAHPLKQRGIVMSDLFDLFVNPLRRLRFDCAS